MKLLKSFGFAFSGILNALRNETNFRIHTVAAISVIWFARVYGLAPMQLAPLVLVICLVMAGELLNTAVEAMVDIISPERCRLAKIAKDSAAGAVLILAAGAVVLAFLTFSDKDRLLNVLEYITKYYPFIIAYIVLCAVYIFLPRSGSTKEGK